MRVTKWFCSGELPSIEGVYNVSCKKTEQSGRWWSHWNGHNFGPFTSDRHEAELIREDYEGQDHAGSCVLDHGSWRGTTEAGQGSAA